jgi:response regulator NasT
MAYLVKPFAKKDLVPAIELARARFAERAALDAEVRTLAERLESRKVVERAKGLLMTRRHLTEPEAFRWLQRTAMNERRSMKVVAEAVLDGTPDAASDGASGDGSDGTAAGEGSSA